MKARSASLMNNFWAMSLYWIICAASSQSCFRWLKWCFFSILGLSLFSLSTFTFLHFMEVSSIWPCHLSIWCEKEEKLNVIYISHQFFAYKEHVRILLFSCTKGKKKFPPTPPTPHVRAGASPRGCYCCLLNDSPLIPQTFF